MNLLLRVLLRMYILEESINSSQGTLFSGESERSVLREEKELEAERN